MLDKLLKFLGFNKSFEYSGKINSIDAAIMFNVDNFNQWFCDKNNNAVYANEGIFLRLDKLSLSQIDDYLLKVFNVTKIDYDKLLDFYEAIKNDWKQKIFLKKD